VAADHQVDARRHILDVVADDETGEGAAAEGSGDTAGHGGSRLAEPEHHGDSGEGMVPQVPLDGGGGVGGGYSRMEAFDEKVTRPGRYGHQPTLPPALHSTQGWHI
jgi:hypothetical protein